MYFLIAGAIALVVIASFLATIFSRDKAGPGAALAGSIVAFVVVTLLFSATTIGARSVGIQTAFGRYQDTLESGFQWTTPWSDVEEFSTQIQDYQFEVPVSFEGGSSGVARGTLLYAIETDGAEELWKDFKTFERVTDLLVEPYTRTEVAAAFSAYQPENARDGQNRSEIQAAIRSALSGEDNDGGTLDGRGILIDSVQITDVELGERAQNSVDRVAEATSNTIRAREEQERAKIEAETARIRQETATPEALTRYCLEVVNVWDVAKNGPLPATLNCNLGAEGQVPVIVNGG